MLRPSGNGGAPPGGSPVPDHLYSLLQEARDASGQVISAHLSDAGFDDIPSAGALVLAAIALNNGAADDHARVPGITRMLGITGPEASQMIDELALRGYLEFRIESGDRGGKSAAVTERGRALLEAAMNAVRAVRWADFPLRRGDIIVSTWPKTGTTWVQMICALLIFQAPELPAPLSELSPWLDLSRVSRDEVYAQLAAHEHRRIIKTHLPLSDIPVDPRATYIVVGRHPLDAALSRYHHLDNEHKAGVPDGVTSRPPEADPRPQRSVSPREWLLRWIDMEPSPQVDYHYLAEMLRHLSAAWARRGEPNVVLVHYEDLSADLEGEMRRVAARLGITVPEAIWPSLVKAAAFEHMRADPDRFVSSGVVFKDNAAFFRSGTSGEGRALLTSAEFARYRARVARLASPDLLAWLHRDNEHA
jgi:aryl sulfotransferase